MSRPIFSFVLLLGVLDALPARAGESAGSASYQRMKKVSVVDLHGFERPLPALSLLVPSDWRFEGKVDYLKGMPCGEMVALSFRAESPDGKLAMEFYPAHVWQWADDPNSRQLMQATNQQGQRWGRAGCDLMPPMRAADFVSKVMLPKVRPGAKVLGVEPLPGANEALKKAAEQEQGQAQKFGLKVRVAADSARARVAYDEKGNRVEEWLSAIVTLHARPLPTFASGRMGQTTSYTGEARFLLAARAPAGQLDGQEKLFQAMISSIRVEPDWMGRVGQVRSNIAATQQKGVADRQKIQQETAQDISRIRNETYQNQQRAQDAQHQQFSQYLRDVETYRNPDTGERVELSNQYGHAWTNGIGEYILSDSPNFNPNQHLNGSWTQMQQVPAR
jgi:hypothetical protein